MTSPITITFPTIDMVPDALRNYIRIVENVRDVGVGYAVDVVPYFPSGKEPQYHISPAWGAELESAASHDYQRLKLQYVKLQADLQEERAAHEASQESWREIMREKGEQYRAAFTRLKVLEKGLEDAAPPPSERLAAEITAHSVTLEKLASAQAELDMLRDDLSSEERHLFDHAANGFRAIRANDTDIEDLRREIAGEEAKCATLRPEAESRARHAHRTITTLLSDARLDQDKALEALSQEATRMLNVQYEAGVLEAGYRVARARMNQLKADLQSRISQNITLRHEARSLMAQAFAPRPRPAPADRKSAAERLAQANIQTHED